MIRFSEMVLPGHPDKLCDQIADRILAEAYAADPQAYCQVEVSCWCDEFFLTGGTATRRPMDKPLDEIVREVGREVGYHAGNAIDSSRWNIRSTVSQEVRDPRTWTEHTNDQCIVVAYAGYDAKTRYLPPEHYLAHVFREALARSCGSGRLVGQGPDGKILVRIREEGADWILEHVLVTIQQREENAFVDVVGWVVADLRDAYDTAQQADSRWRASWNDVEVMVNPNGPLVNGGPDGDNGQTGRKLVMDYYGPRVPIGGGALSGKDLTHVDRAGAYMARKLAVGSVGGGATDCVLRVAYAPNLDEPLDVVVEQIGGAPIDRRLLSHEAIRREIREWRVDPELGRGTHFFGDRPWNQASPPARQAD
ncbi:MAG: methionine adenosyltransferase domain-containing protein [Fimbriimonadaceae bacterium]